MDANLDFDDKYGVKIDALVEGFTEYIQNNLMEKCQKWENSSQEDFFITHPHKKWREEEQEKINSRDITKWDTPLCVKWLLEFPWEPHERKLNEDEKNALIKLRDIRNRTKHFAKPKDATQIEFDEHCTTVEKALSILGADPKTVTKIIEDAKNRVFADKKNLLHVIERWNYTTSKVLGSGSFGVVIAASDTVDHQIYAIKIIPNRKRFGDTDEVGILRELRNQAKLDHPNVVKYKSSDRFSLSTEKMKKILQWGDHTNKISAIAREFFAGCFDSASNGLVTGFYIKMEICGETLREWLNKILKDGEEPKMSTSEEIGQGIADGLNYIHGKGITHRDLRPDNIYFSALNFVTPVKIGDFGLSIQSKINESETMTLAEWNIRYRAPEMDEEHKDGKAKYGQHADLFSFGLILSEIFDPTKEINLAKKFEKIKYHRNTGSKLQKVLWLNSLILRLTEEEPNKRNDLRDYETETPIKIYVTAQVGFLNEQTKEIERKTFDETILVALGFYKAKMRVHVEHHFFNERELEKVNMQTLESIQQCLERGAEVVNRSNITFNVFEAMQSIKQKTRSILEGIKMEFKQNLSTTVAAIAKKAATEAFKAYQTQLQGNTRDVDPLKFTKLHECEVSKRRSRTRKARLHKM